MPCRCKIEDIVWALPKEVGDELRTKLHKLAKKVIKANTFNGKKLVKDIDKDIMYCKRNLAEPWIDYQKQELYWNSQEYNVKSMAHSPAFSYQDIKLTAKFLLPYKTLIKGGEMIDVCSGCSRLGKNFSKLYNKISVLDLNPSFGKIPSYKQGELIKANFKDIGVHIEPNRYHFMLLNWSFCYINYDDIKRVLPFLHRSLKSNG